MPQSVPVSAVSATHLNLNSTNSVVALKLLACRGVYGLETKRARQLGLSKYRPALKGRSADVR